MKAQYNASNAQRVYPCRAIPNGKSVSKVVIQSKIAGSTLLTTTGLPDLSSSVSV